MVLVIDHERHAHEDDVVFSLKSTCLVEPVHNYEAHWNTYHSTIVNDASALKLKVTLESSLAVFVDDINGNLAQTASENMQRTMEVCVALT